MEDIHHEVQVEIELKLFRDEVASEHLLRDKHLPSLKELVLLSAVEARWQSAKQLFWIVVQSKRKKEDHQHIRKIIIFFQLAVLTTYLDRFEHLLLTHSLL